MQILRGGRTHFIGIGKALLGQHHGRLLQLIQRTPQRLRKFFEPIHLRGRIHVAFHQLEEATHQTPAFHRQLPSHQIERLHRVRAFIDLRNARITHVLLDAVLLDVPVPTERLQRDVRVVEALVGEKRLDHRRHERHEIFGRFTHRRIGMAMLKVDPNTDPVRQRAHAFVERLDAQQAFAHIGMHQNGIGRSRGILGARERPPLHAVLRIRQRILIRDFGQPQSLQAHGETRAVHHHEHRAHALVRVADHPAGRLLEVEHARGRRLDAHLVLYGTHRDAVSRARRAVVVWHKLGHQEQRNPLRTTRRIGQLGEHQVYDILGEVVITGRDEDFRAGNRVGAVAGRNGFGVDHAEIGTRVRLRQAHRTAPRAVNELGEKPALQLVRSVTEQRAHGPVRKSGIHTERQVR